MLGHIQIYFGKVVSVTDELKLNRCQISIDGLTDEIVPEDLPWYFPWNGTSFLPILNDVVPVICFDENISTCFYGRKLDLVDLKLTDGDYESYLEIYKRTIDDKNVQLTYTKSKGIEILNDKGKIQLEKEKLSLFIDTLGITITKDKIDIGTSGEASLLGDKTVSQLTDMIKHQANTITEMMTLFNAISTACVTPFTAPIKAALTPMIPISQTKLNTENSTLKSGTSSLQSKKVFIE